MKLILFLAQSIDISYLKHPPSPIAISVARTLGTIYICASTKDLQAQYARDFPFVRMVKGKNNFTCNVRLFYREWHVHVYIMSKS